MSERPHRKVRSGVVVSDKMDKTVVVSVETFTSHKLYKRRVKQTKRFKAHDEENKCVGDRVRIMKQGSEQDKRWRVVEIIEKAIN